MSFSVKHAKVKLAQAMASGPAGEDVPPLRTGNLNGASVEVELDICAHPSLSGAEVNGCNRRAMPGSRNARLAPEMETSLDATLMPLVRCACLPAPDSKEAAKCGPSSETAPIVAEHRTASIPSQTDIGCGPAAEVRGNSVRSEKPTRITFSVDEQARLERIRTIDPQMAAKVALALGDDYSFEGLCLLLEYGHGTGVAAQYRALGIPVNRDTVVRHYTDLNLSKEPKLLGKGAVNPVYRVTHKFPNDYLKRVGAFKVENRSIGQPARDTGIDETFPRLGMRNIAAARVSRLLGFNVIPEARFATHKDQLGIVMDIAEGEPGINGLDRNHPGIRRELVKLQLLDVLVAQVDRHMDNYIIDKMSDSRAVVCGIDNDLCFGRLVVGSGKIAVAPVNSVGMPPVIDSKMRDAIMKLDETRLREELSSLLAEEEVDATVFRLRDMQGHIRNMHPESIIASRQWSDDSVSEALFADPGNNYLGRDLATFGML